MKKTSPEITPTKEAKCSTCTVKLVEYAYKRKPLFRLLREPLRLGMKLFAWICRIRTDEYIVRKESCKNCMRFYKVVLKEKSRLFARLNAKINPIFDRIIEGIVTKEELAECKEIPKRN